MVGGYNEDGKKRQSIPDGYTHISQDLFRLTMTELSKDLETPDFKMPSSVVRVGVEKGSNPASLPSSYTPSSQIVTELFVKGTEPKARSEKFDKLDPVKGLKAAYDEDSNSIQVDWQYKNDADVEFEISSSVNGGSMKVLSTTTDTTFDISEVEPGADYTIQVVVVDKGDSSNRSDAVTTKLTLQSEETEEPDEDDEQEEVKNVPPVSNLDAKYDGEKLIVKWNYDGPPAKFEVSVNGQTQTVKSQGIDIKGVQPGQSYTIVVTSISDQQDNIRSEQKSVTIQIPKDTDEDEPVDGDGEDSDSD
ncbi:fibronectin type III domain-containing protein [Paracerasibacillus soli]|uniref:Fibronectin type III domain-containing protein n=1 Tax=Paracerasibacillus soli TaxID=480284 RepID=A0ABU5CPM9_9BACI|nr:fibronectin type III domain-containing protein [Virgibacillus soli]MDY0408294.1 fibronectin type III domain-containing protein [Virgibacillus soli]